MLSGEKTEALLMKKRSRINISVLFYGMFAISLAKAEIIGIQLDGFRNHKGQILIY